MKRVAELNPGLLKRYGDPVKALFALKIITIPSVAHALIKNVATKTESELLCFGAMATFPVAFVRMFRERTLRYCIQQRVKLSQAQKAFEKASLLKWFDDSPEGLLYWIARFEQWRRYAQRSFLHFINKQSRDLRQLRGNLRDAAMLGILEKLGSLPDKVRAEFAHLLADPDGYKVFRKNSRPSRYSVRPESREIDAWLIEIWPLVLEYGWNYRDLATVINTKFNLSDRTHNELGNLKDRCDKLGLNLSAAGSKPGAPKKLPDGAPPALPRMTDLALQLETIAEDPSTWLLAWTSELIEKPTPKNQI